MRKFLLLFGAFFRLKQNDLNGKYTYSKIIIAKKCSGSEGDISVFPNPTTSIVNVNFGNREGLNYELFNLSGTLMEKGNLTENQTISLENQSASMYFLKIFEKGKTVKTVKILRQ